MPALRHRPRPAFAADGAPVRHERGQTLLQFLLFGAIIAIAWLGTVSFMGTPPTPPPPPPTTTTLPADAVPGCTQWQDSEAGLRHQIPGDTAVHLGPCP